MTKTVTMSRARNILSQLIDESKDEPIIISRSRKPAAILLDYNTYEEAIQTLENARDTRIYDTIISEGEPNIPWEEIVKELGVR